MLNLFIFLFSILSLTSCTKHYIALPIEPREARRIEVYPEVIVAPTPIKPMIATPVVERAYPLPSSVRCTPRLMNSVKTIYRIPEARKLIAKISEDGPIRIEVQNNGLSNEFGAFWDQDNRVICVEMTPRTTEGDIISSILFELHNAAVSREFDRLDNLATKRQISREKYVQSVEYLEYCNSLMASEIASKGIEAGFFPPNALLPTYKNFEEHYRYQKIGGHSSWIAHTYDQLSS